MDYHKLINKKVSQPVGKWLCTAGREANNITVQLKDIQSQNDHYAHNIMTLTNLDL